MQRRPWGNAPKEERPGPLQNLFGWDKAREKEEKWKAFEAKKEKVLEEIDDFRSDRDRIRYRFTDKFLDGMEDHEIAGRLADLVHHDRIKQRSSTSNGAMQHRSVQRHKASSAWTEDLWGDYYDKESDLVRDFLIRIP